MRRLSLNRSESAKKSGQNIPKNRCRTTIAERMVETRAELPFIGDQVVCLSHNQSGRRSRVSGIFSCVADVAFHKKCGIAITEMVKSPWVYRRLRNFRAGIEAAISCFKRAYGGARCTWRGLDHFKAYIWSAVVAHNLVLFARLKPA